MTQNPGGKRQMQEVGHWGERRTLRIWIMKSDKNQGMELCHFISSILIEDPSENSSQIGFSSLLLPGNEEDYDDDEEPIEAEVKFRLGN